MPASTSALSSDASCIVRDAARCRLGMPGMHPARSASSFRRQDTGEGTDGGRVRAYGAKVSGAAAPLPLPLPPPSSDDDTGGSSSSLNRWWIRNAMAGARWLIEPGGGSLAPPESEAEDPDAPRFRPRATAPSTRFLSWRILTSSCVPLFCAIRWCIPRSRADVAPKASQKSPPSPSPVPSPPRTHASTARPASLPATTSGVIIAETGTLSATSSFFRSLTVLTWHPIDRSYISRSAGRSTAPHRASAPPLPLPAAPASRALSGPPPREDDPADPPAPSPGGSGPLPDPPGPLPAPRPPGAGASYMRTGAFRVPSVASPLTTHKDEWTAIPADLAAHRLSPTRRDLSAPGPPDGALGPFIMSR